MAEGGDHRSSPREQPCRPVSSKQHSRSLRAARRFLADASFDPACGLSGRSERHPDVGVAPLDIPCLMLMADRDPALRPEYCDDMPERCSNLEMHLIKNAGHWVQQEQPEVFNAHLLGWLQRHFAVVD